MTTPPEEKAPPAPEEKQAQPEPVTPAAPPTKPAPPQNGVDPRPIVNTYEPPAKKTPQGYSGPPPGFGSPSTTNAWNWGNFFKGVKNAAIDSYVNTVANAFTLGLYGMAKSGAEAYSIARSPAETWGGITSFVQSNPEEAAGMAAYYAFEAVLAGTVVGAELASVERGLSNTIREGKQANHIFSGKMGKFMDTQANRSLITDLSNDPANFCGVDQYGKSWFAKTLPNGTQIYSYAQDGIIKGAGVNSTPVNLVGKYGLR